MFFNKPAAFFFLLNTEQITWELPLGIFYKMNCNITINMVHNKVSHGAIARNNKGEVIAAVARGIYRLIASE